MFSVVVKTTGCDLACYNYDTKHHCYARYGEKYADTISLQSKPDYWSGCSYSKRYQLIKVRNRRFVAVFTKLTAKYSHFYDWNDQFGENLPSKEQCRFHTVIIVTDNFRICCNVMLAVLSITIMAAGDVFGHLWFPAVVTFYIDWCFRWAETDSKYKLVLLTDQQKYKFSMQVYKCITLDQKSTFIQIKSNKSDLTFHIVVRIFHNIYFHLRSLHFLC